MNSVVLLEFLRSHRLAVQASVSSASRPQAAVIGIAVSDRFEIVFDTLETTRKAQNLRHNSNIALVIGGLTAGDERTEFPPIFRTPRLGAMMISEVWDGKAKFHSGVQARGG
jgi:hypothetical protein